MMLMPEAHALFWFLSYVCNSKLLSGELDALHLSWAYYCPSPHAYHLSRVNMSCLSEPICHDIWDGDWIRYLLMSYGTYSIYFIETWFHKGYSPIPKNRRSRRQQPSSVATYLFNFIRNLNTKTKIKLKSYYVYLFNLFTFYTLPRFTVLIQ